MWAPSGWPRLTLVEFPPRSDDPELEKLLASNRFVMRIELGLIGPLVLNPTVSIKAT